MSDVISVSTEGNSAHYVNPGWYFSKAGRFTIRLVSGAVIQLFSYQKIHMIKPLLLFWASLKFVFKIFRFLNLGGYVHDLFTVSEVVSTLARGSPSAECSWFPGLVLRNFLMIEKTILNEKYNFIVHVNFSVVCQ